MKKYIHKIFSLVLALLAMSCDSYLDINTNPNNPTVTNPDYVLSGALVETARIKSQELNTLSCYLGGYFASSGTYSQSGDQRRTYGLTTNNGLVIAQWATFYANAANYNFVESQVKSLADYDNYIAVCKIMKAYVFQNLVDMYGNIPYTDALTGFVQLSPKYDEAQSIYDALSVELETAVKLIADAPTTAKPLIASVDVMFSGNMNSWAALANTIRLRLLIHQSALSSRQSYIQGEIGKIIANGKGFLTVDAMIQPGYKKSAGQQNPFWEANGWTTGNAIAGGGFARDYNRASNLSLNFFKASTDPRIDYFFRYPGQDPGTNVASPVASGYKGIDFGALPAAEISSAATSGFGIGIMGSPDQSVFFFTAAQSYFLQAEAAQRGWLTGTPKTLFESGITASFTSLGVPNAATAATAYYTSGKIDIDWTASIDKIKAIVTQKWAANYAIDGLEAWTDVRRVGIPSVPLSIDPGRISNVAPVRLLYPISEYSSNTASVKAQGEISQFTSKIFWNQ
jgi:Starch-binding associating with outer membrane